VKVKFETNINDITIQDLLIMAMEGGSNYWVDRVEAVYVNKILRTVESIEEMRKYVQEGTGYSDKIDYDVTYPLYSWLPLMSGGSDVFVYGMEEGETKREYLTREKIGKGLQTMADKYPEHFSAILTEEEDGETADVFLQCCLFGEIVYG
jgi:hypothetical protein